MNVYLNILLSFVATAIAEPIYILWIRRTSQGKAFSGATYGSTIWVIGAIVVISYVDNKWMIIPAFLGSWISGYLTIKFDEKRRNKCKEENATAVL